MEIKIKVSGRLIQELSEQLPSNIIALNELIKNAYDADANKVVITLDSAAKTLTIDDDGEGMDEDAINTLFHISKSTKKYGTINKHKRFTQGSKGFGFLSVFKFGKKVCLITKKAKGKGLTFKVDYDSLVDVDNLTSQEVPLEEYPKVEKGTEIIVNLDNAKSLQSYFQKPDILLKIVYSFEDPNFEIILRINGVVCSSKDRPSLKDIYKERQLYYVTYNSKEQKIKYYHNDCLILQEDYKFQRDDCQIDIELMIYHFKPREKQLITSLYYNPQGDLTPLVYINSNLFNNYNIFDPNIMKNIKTTDVLNQMIGSVRIFSSSPMLTFNPDRSHFLQNEFTGQIIEFMEKINKCIQITGSKYKKYFVEKKNKVKFGILNTYSISNNYVNDKNFLRNIIKDEIPFKDKVKISRVGNRIEYSFAGEKIYLDIQSSPTSGTNDPKGNSSTSETDNKITTAKIILNSESKLVYVPSKQMNLLKEIKYANDSKNKKIDIEKIIVKDGNSVLKGAILQSVVKSCKKNIYYFYNDPNTGNVTALMKLDFIEPQSKIKSSSYDSSLIYIPVQKNYHMSIDPFLEKLINQINSLDIDDYTGVLACALRATFEISIDSINKSSKYKIKFTGDLKTDVNFVIDYIKNNKKYITEIDNSTKIGYNVIKNFLDSFDVEFVISKLHLGAHKSIQYITKDDIIKLGKLAGMFLVIANEMKNNPKIS